MLFSARILVKALALAACAVALCGCGQKGPLYLPARPVAPAADVTGTPLPAQQPDDADQAPPAQDDPPPSTQ